MLAIPELAMPRSSKVTTVCNGKREIWTDYEEAKAYFLELMMTTEGEEHERAECVYIAHTRLVGMFRRIISSGASYRKRQLAFAMFDFALPS